MIRLNSPRPLPKPSRYRRPAQLKWILSLILVLTTAIFIVFGPLFQVKQILCQIDINPCPSELLGLLSQFKHRNLLFLNRRHIHQQLANFDPQYQQITITFDLLDTLRVEIISRQPVARLIIAGMGEFLVDSQGVILPLRPALDHLPRVQLATPSTDLLLTATKLSRLLDRSFISYKTITSTQSAIFDVDLKTGSQARFSSLKDLEFQVNSLQLILHKSTIVPLPRFIDVRFDKPVLIY